MPFAALRSFFERAARWVFYLALIFAPWAYGATDSWGIRRLNWLLLTTLCCWVMELLVSRRVPRLSLILVVSGITLLGLGWWMTVNAGSIRDWQYEMFVPRRQLVAGAAGSVDYASSVAFMLRVTILLGATWFVADAMRRPEFVLELWWVIAITGTSISLLGLLQKATGAEMIFWAHPQGPEPPSSTFFATYYYHANAGAFLNLTWPFTAGLALRSIERGSHPLVRALLVSCLVIDLVAVMANTSRMAQVVATLMLLLLLVVFAPKLFKRATDIPWQLRTGIAILLAGIIIVIAYASHWEQALARWQLAGSAIREDERWRASQVGWQAAKHAGWFGFGPGAFRAVFPRYQDPTDLGGTWAFLHQDYLQMIIEWGWAGAAISMVIFFGGVVNGAKALWRSGRTLPRHRFTVRLAIIALLGVATHALVDFPLQIASMELYAAACLGIAWGMPAGE
jgi:O-Antigen ligase